MELTKEQIEKIKKSSLSNLIKFEFSVNCMLCGKEITAKSEKEIKGLLNNHINNECNSARWIRFCTKELDCKTLGDVVKMMKKIGVISCEKH